MTLAPRPRFECPECHEAEVQYVGGTDDARTELRCRLCDHQWLHGGQTQVRPTSQQPVSRDTAYGQFPTADSVAPDIRQRVEAWKTEFLGHWPSKKAGVEEYWARYQWLFSAEGLPEADPAELKYFENSSTGAHPGNMSVFDRAWNEMGDDAAAAHLRNAIDYLLRGPAHIPVEDRLSRLIDPQDPLGMTGFRESLLTKVLCVTEPDRFIPILTYSSTGGGGKREIAQVVFDLGLPGADTTAWTRGRLAFWSNDLLLSLVGPGLIDNQHTGQFLWWAKDRGTT